MEKKELNIISWHGKPDKYDIRDGQTTMRK